MAKAITYDPSAASSSESEMLRDLDALLHSAGAISVTSSQGRTVSLTDSFKQLLHNFAHAAAHNDSLLIYTGPHDLSAREAADLLNVSHPYLIEHVLERGQIPFHLTGAQRRIALADALAFLHLRDAQRHQRLRRLSQMSEEMGLGGDK
jgi:excisionase family DNA binding protein